MDCICVWFRIFCRCNINPCKIRDPENGVHCGNRYSHHYRTYLFLDHGIYNGISESNWCDWRKDSFIFDSVGIATGVSWLCYFKALQLGDINKVVPIDKSSIVLTILPAFLLLGEPIGLRQGIGVLLIGVGTFLMIEKKAETNGVPVQGKSWMLYAFGSAIFASLTSILGKIGIEGVESNLGTAIRTAVVLVMAWIMVLVTGKAQAVREISVKELSFICLSGFATGASWLCYYRALQDGLASVVVPIDKLSILVTVAFSWLVFHEKLTARSGWGLALIVAGTLAMIF